jgi:hypothetical protein
MHTPESLRARRRHLDRRRHSAACVIAEMAHGAALHLTFTKSGRNFVLSNGTPVSTDIALLVVNDVRVVSVNDVVPDHPANVALRDAMSSGLASTTATNIPDAVNADRSISPILFPRNRDGRPAVINTDDLHRRRI